MNKRIIVALLGLVTLTACEPLTAEQKQAAAQKNQERVERETRFIGTVDGCRIWEVYNEHGTNPFLARCPEGAADTFEQHTTGGKTKTTVNTFTLGEN